MKIILFKKYHEMTPQERIIFNSLEYISARKERFIFIIWYWMVPILFLGVLFSFGFPTIDIKIIIFIFALGYYIITLYDYRQANLQINRDFGIKQKIKVI